MAKIMRMQLIKKEGEPIHNIITQLTIGNGNVVWLTKQGYEHAKLDDLISIDVKQQKE